MKLLYKLKTLSKRNIIILFALLFVITIFMNLRTNNDIWFLLNHGRYVLEHGFPTIEPFTIHENLSFVMQQWGSAVILYKVFDWFGKVGLFLLPVIMMCYFLWINYKTCMLLSNRRYQLSVYITCFIGIFISHFFVARPQIFSLTLLSTELYFLEKYIYTKSWKSLISLPIISLLLINFHSSMWFMQFLFLLPYCIELFWKERKTGWNSLKPFIVIIPLMIMLGLINPYGIDAINYLISSYGIEEINHTVNEMKVPNITTMNGKIIFLAIGVVYLSYMFYQKRKISIRHFLLLIGTTYLSLSSYKGQSFFLLASVFPLALHFKKDFYRESELIESKMTRVQRSIYVLSLLFLFLFPLIINISTNQIVMKSGIENGMNYLLENSTIPKEKIRLYTNYNLGGYPEFLGIKSYLDPRAEVFLKANNHQSDIFKEYVELSTGDLLYEDFIEKYQFTHLLVTTKEFLYKYLEKDPNYQRIFFEEEENLSYAIYEKINIK